MKIKFLTLLEQNLKGPNGKCEGASILEIEQLESPMKFDLSNDSYTLPTAFREFLFLAGRFCGYFHSGGGNFPIKTGSQQGENDFMYHQQNRTSFEGTELIVPNRGNFSSYPFWSFGYQAVQNEFLFVDFFEKTDDPTVYYTDVTKIERETGKYGKYIRDTGYRLIEFIEKHINYFNENNTQWPYKIETLTKPIVD